MYSSKKIFKSMSVESLVSQEVSLTQVNDVNCPKHNWKFPLGTTLVITVLTLTSCICISFVLLDLYRLQHPTSQQDRVALDPQLKVISCYYNTPAHSNISSRQLLPSHIDPYLCTHINVAFARVVQKQIYLETAQAETIQQVVELKRVNPSLKVLLSVGGAGTHNGFSEMVIDHASRKTFIKSIKNVLRNFGLDGVDLDWEFPALHLRGNQLATRERQHFSQLLREIRMEYVREQRDYLLTVALAAPQTIADVSYDVDQINLYVDYANIMTYDFHYYSKFTPFTGFNSPLYRRATEGLYLATLNVNYTVHMYAAKGLDKNKIVIGIPTYGHTFTLVNADNPNVGSPASGFGALGGLGFVDYPEVCSFIESDKVTLNYDEEARVPFAVGGLQWVSFESPRSVAAKAALVRRGGWRGAMLYALNADDYEGRCGPRRGPAAAFPLARSVRRALRPPAAYSHHCKSNSPAKRFHYLLFFRDVSNFVHGAGFHVRGARGGRPPLRSVAESVASASARGAAPTPPVPRAAHPHRTRVLFIAPLNLLLQLKKNLDEFLYCFWCRTNDHTSHTIYVIIIMY